jgi:membrane glycosyltransferase
MGSNVIDQYSLLHFAVGIVAYFWGISWQLLLLLHILFELVENTKEGMYFITNYVSFWPGGKPKPDSLLNMVSDNAFSLLGWFASRFADSVAMERHLYP